jgi:glycosyltransferase involved in cell wall biosynthesis
MTTLVIQIPCHNEASTLPAVLGELPRTLPGVDRIVWLVIDDGSTDGTEEVARKSGADVVVRLPRQSGLSRAFLAGIDRALALGADLIVNTDGDHQYRAADIPALIAPILARKAELVIGTRPVDAVPHFSPLKKLLQRLGSAAVRRLSGTEVEDAPSGFRAIARGAAQRLHVFNRYSYTVETLIQAGQKGMVVTTVPVGVNPPTRPSRLVKSLFGYAARQGAVMLRVFMVYRPLRFFGGPGLLLALAGTLIGVRFLVFWFTGDGQGHVQSLILAALLIGVGVALIITGLLADLMAVNRSLLEEIDWRVRRIEDRLARGESKDQR